MNQEEMRLAVQILAELRNATGKGYDILVQGTVLSNYLDIFGVFLWIVSMIAISMYLYKKMEIKDRDGDTLLGFIVLVCVIGVVLVFAYNAILNGVLGIVAPEYTVLHSLVGSAST